MGSKCDVPESVRCTSWQAFVKSNCGSRGLSFNCEIYKPWTYHNRRGWLLQNERYRTKQQGGGAFFFQAEDGIRDKLVTGVQTCALPIRSVRRAGSRLRITGQLIDASSGVHL